MTEPRKKDRLVGLFSYIFIPIIPALILVLTEEWHDDEYKQNIVQAFVLGLLLMAVKFAFWRLGYVGVLGLVVWIYSIVLGVMYFIGKPVSIPGITKLGKDQGWF